MARRRGVSGQGSVFFRKDKGLWVAKLTLHDGRSKQKYNKKQQVVKDWLLTERGKIQQGIFTSSEKMTVETFLKRYLEDYGKRALRVTTYESYKAVIEKHIIPSLGTIKLASLRADQINHLLSQIEANRSARFTEYVYAIVKASLNMAVKWGLIAKNPALMVSPPKVKFKVPTTWSAKELQALLEHVKKDRWAGIYYLACVGMRKGEILGLPLSSLHLDKGYLMVTQTVQFVPGQGLLLLEPKTEKSRRMIVLPDFVKEALRMHLLRRESLSKKPLWKESGLVFTTDIGTPINPQNMLKHFKKNLTEAGLTNIKFHSLRHTVASLLLTEKNVHPKFVAELLGHSSINLTLNTYSHIINPMNTVTADAMEDIVHL